MTKNKTITWKLEVAERLVSKRQEKRLEDFWFEIWFGLGKVIWKRNTYCGTHCAALEARQLWSWWRGDIWRSVEGLLPPSASGWTFFLKLKNYNLRTVKNIVSFILINKLFFIQNWLMRSRDRSFPASTLMKRLRKLT